MPANSLKLNPTLLASAREKARAHAVTHYLRWLVAASLLLLAFAPAVRAEVTVADPGTFVVDKAGLLDAQTQQLLETKLKELEQRTTAQVKLLTVKSLDDEDIFSFAQRQFELWTLGVKGKDNGALIVLSLEPHGIRIHTGYGLEGALPDSWCGTLARRIAGQYFKQQRFSEGLRELTLEVIGKVAAEYGVQIAGARRPQPQAAQPGTNLGGLVCMVFFLIFVFPVLASIIMSVL
ncbi:MAG TPA: TPM domain-containing protein, partial [Pirellulales bacterium]|nr:TPM domain-containing protein [Pirellulales bacterium]